MTQQEFPPMPAMTPSLTVTDPQATLAWFGKLGFVTMVEMAMPDGSLMHAEVGRGPAVRIMLGPAAPEMGRLAGGGGMTLYITLQESVDALHDQAVAGGVAISQPPTDQFWGDRTFTARHPDGYEIMFAQNTRVVTPEEMAAAMKQFAPA